MFNLKIKDSDFGYENLPLNNPRTRIASRGIVLNGDKIALLYKANKNEYKLPGGGVEENEEIESTFIREILEETGCNVEIIKKLGTTEEFKSHTNFYQLSHVFLSKLIEDTKSLNLTEKEIAEGSTPIWTTIDEAISLMKNSFDILKESPYDKSESIYATKFIVLRDLEILNNYKNSIKQ